MITQREMIASVYGAVSFIEWMPETAKSEVLLSMAKKIGIKPNEVMDMSKELGQTLEYILSRGVKP